MAAAVKGGDEDTSVDDDDEDWSFKDLVEKFAAMKDLTFVPHPKGAVTQEGKPIYLFGRVPVYLDKKCIYADGVCTLRWCCVCLYAC